MQLELAPGGTHPVKTAVVALPSLRTGGSNDLDGFNLLIRLRKQFIAPACRSNTTAPNAVEDLSLAWCKPLQKSRFLGPHRLLSET